MDADRQIRFLLPSALFIASLWWGWHAWTGHWVPSDLTKDSLTTLVGVIAGGSVLVIAAGYVIGTLTQTFLRVLFWFLRCKLEYQFYEAALPARQFEQLWGQLGLPPAADRKRELHAVVTFDHGLLRGSDRFKGVHEWTLRRWNGFNVAANTCFGLIGSLLFGPYVLGIAPRGPWLIPVLVFAGLLALVACRSWREAMAMTQFMVSLQVPELRLVEQLRGPEQDGKDT